MMWNFINGWKIKIAMDNWRWLGIWFLLTHCLMGTANADDNEIQPDMDFFEFLGEGKKVDGEYHDPLQMQDWKPKEMVDAGQQYEVTDYE